MSQEITITASLTGYKPSVMSSALGRSVNGLQFSMAGNFVSEGVMLVGTSATLIPLGQVTSPHWAFFSNRDGNYFITIRNGSGGADLLKLLPGECAFLPLLDSAVPYGLANTLACLMEYMIFSL